LADLGLTFPTAEDLTNENEDTQNAGFFGPSNKQLNKFDAWEGCEDKMFKPYNKKDKIGKISDFVSAAIQAAKEKERELDKAATHKLEKEQRAQDRKTKTVKVKEEAKVED
jgi:SLT domain-containing protein